jgi:hypothetical protein
VLDYFNAEFASQEYRLRELLRTIALSSAFRRVTPVDPAAQPAAEEADKGLLQAD